MTQPWMQDPREMLARTLMAEAGNQGPTGLLAAGSVIMNRARTPGYGDGVIGAILKPGQFSPWNSVTGYARGVQGQDMSAIRPTQEVYSIADNLLSGNYQDPTGGATHFFNPDISNPAWARGKEWTRIGDHVFGNADAGRQGGSTMGAGGRPQPTMATQGQPEMQQQERLPFRDRLRQAAQSGQLMDNAAMAFNSLRMRPDPDITQMAMQRQEGRQEEARANRTAEALERMGRPDLARMVGEGALDAKSALGIALSPQEAVKGVEIDGRLVNPTTGEVMADFSGGADPNDVSSARKEFVGLKPVKDFSTQTSAYGRILSSVEDPSAAGDLALIFNYMKVLDPGSTVREGEFATAQNAAGVDERVRGLFNRIANGERLTPQQRADFADRATRLYQGAERQYQGIADQYRQFAEAAGLPVEQVIPDFGYSGNLYETPLEFSVPPAPTGVSDEDWGAAWANMTDDERRQFIDGAER